MMLTIIPLLAFHIGSLYLSYEDFKARFVTLWILLATLIAGLTCSIPTQITLDLLIPCFLFFAIVLSVSFVKTNQATAWADITYFLVIILLIKNLWWLFFICIGILTVVFHYASGQKKDQPFIAILYGAYILTTVFSYKIFV